MTKSPPQSVCPSAPKTPRTVSLFAATDEPSPAPIAALTTSVPTESPTELTVATPESDVTIGEDVCACQPSTYRFKLDFSRSCVDNSMLSGGAVNLCCEDPKAPYEQINAVVFVEYDEDYSLIESSKIAINGEFKSGDVVEFNSVTAGNTTALKRLPKFWEVYFDGVDAEGKRVGGLWAIRWDLEVCDVEVISGGEHLGIMEFVSHSVYVCLPLTPLPGICNTTLPRCLPCYSQA